jgi:nucleoside-diphosphate-sugar epimerase
MGTDANRVRLSPVCVTGGSGVVGRAVVTALLDAGKEVCVLDPNLPPEPLAAHVRYIAASTADPSALAHAVDGCDAVVHLAASLPQARLDATGFWKANVGATLSVAEASVAAGVRRLVFASTIEIYGAQESAVPLDEEAPRRFTGHYSRNKWECEQRLAEVAARSGIEVCALRMPMVFGPGFHHEPSVLRIFHALHHSWPLPLSAPEARTSFVAASDCGQAFLLALDSPGAPGESFNIAAADMPTMAMVMRDIIASVGSRSPLVPLPQPVARAAVALAKRVARLRGGSLGGTPAELMDFALTGGAYAIDKARRLLGYAPQLSCAQAWADTYRWYWASPEKRLDRERRTP